MKISPDDLRIDIFHAGGHGGQNVNKVATAVRIVHEPSGLTVVCQDERSQYKNKQRAMAMLRARLFEAEQDRQDAAISQARRSQVGAAERSEKDPDLQLPAGPDYRPPTQRQLPRHPQDHGRRPRRHHRPHGVLGRRAVAGRRGVLTWPSSAKSYSQTHQSPRVRRHTGRSLWRLRSW